MTRRIAWAVALAVTFGAAPAARAAEPWAAWSVPDSALAAALQSGRAAHEATWNALLVAELRARLSGDPRAAGLLELALRVARAEPAALGSGIATDAMKLRARWSKAEMRERVLAAEAESLAVAAENARRADDADRLYPVALAHYRACGERRRAAWMLGFRGRNAFTAGRVADADGIVREALAARRALGDARMVGASLYTLSSIAIAAERWADALAFAGEAGEVRTGTGEWAGLGQALNNLALAHQNLGRPDSAAAAYERGLGYTVAAGDSGRTLELLVNYGTLLAHRENDARSEAILARALSLARARGDLPNEARARTGLALRLVGAGRFTEARAALELPAGAEARLGVRERTALWIERGHVELAQQNAAASRPAFERALALADSSGAVAARIDALDDLAIAARLERDLAAAERRARAALEAAVAAGDSFRVRQVSSTLGQIASDRRDGAAALAWFGRAAGLAPTVAPGKLPEDLVNLGVVARDAGRLDDAARRFESARDAALAAGATDLVWPALIGLADVAKTRGDLAGALRYGRAAATCIDTLRAKQGERQAIGVLARRRFAVDQLIDVLARHDGAHPDSGFSAEAFAWAERARARALLDLVASRSGEAPRLVTLEATRATLAKDEALLEYSVGDSSTALWVITRRGSTLHVLPGRAALQARVGPLRRGLADPERALAGASLDAAFGLYRIALEPARRSLRGAKRLVVSADGPLSLVPFEALLTAEPRRGSDGETRPPAARDWLASAFDVSYAFSASARAAEAARPGAAGRGVVAVGDARFAGRLSALPNTARELETLRRLAGTRPFAALAGAAATRDSVRALPALRTAALVHFATHGEANEIEPDRSGLWLSPAAGDSLPGFLDVADVRGLALDASLVTLSACETGLGRLERGEGVVGLTRAFVAAGARSVLVSLWKVDDRSTEFLMSAFYEGLLEKGLPSDRALARARRSLLASPGTRAPFHWAAFVLAGAPGPLD